MKLLLKVRFLYCLNWLGLIGKISIELVWAVEVGLLYIHTKFHEGPLQILLNTFNKLCVIHWWTLSQGVESANLAFSSTNIGPLTRVRSFIWIKDEGIYFSYLVCLLCHISEKSIVPRIVMYSNQYLIYLLCCFPKRPGSNRPAPPSESI